MKDVIYTVLITFIASMFVAIYSVLWIFEKLWHGILYCGKILCWGGKN